MHCKLMTKGPFILITILIGALNASAQTPIDATVARLKKPSAKSNVVYTPVPVTFTRQCIDPSKTITIAAVGDVLLHDTYQKWAAEQPLGYYGSFAPVREFIQAADIAVANLEGPTAAGIAPNGKPVPPPAVRYDGVVYRGYPMFNYHPSLVANLKRLGIAVLQTANNHALDRQELGVNRTIEAIEAEGLLYTGTRHSRQTAAPWFAKKSVIKDGRIYSVAFVACTYGTNGMPDNAHQVMQCFEQREELLSIIRQLHSQQDTHAVIVLPHWGSEYHSLPDPRQTGLAKEMIEAGATAILGTHPHVVQPMERITSQDGREGVVLYSMGNFVSHQVGLPRLSSLIFLLGLAPGERGKLVPSVVGWIPLRMQTGGSFSIDPIDRLSQREANAARTHLLGSFSEKTMHPARLPYWAQFACSDSDEQRE